MTAPTDARPLASSPAGAGPDPAAGAAQGRVATLLRAEGAVALAAAVLTYRATGGSWLTFGLLFLLPDLSMLGYLVDRRLGAALYNAGHTYLGPAALGAIGWSLPAPVLIGPALIWAAHVGFDRLMGYGLKYATAFGATHLGWRGRREDVARGRHPRPPGAR